ncbi:hypothetical protein GCM10008967_30760 [Bacillus carboniphilus]|uniref:Uncharacterized protein n=1 Tax=Bacillus carboniphilus TaxID=86663 RepID=A0ABP3G8P6_9BACI
MLFLYILVLIPVNIFLFIQIGKLFFDDMDHFWECVKLDLRPDIFSFFKGELGKDWAAEFRLGAFGILCGIIILIEVGIGAVIF